MFWMIVVLCVEGCILGESESLTYTSEGAVVSVDASENESALFDPRHETGGESHWPQESVPPSSDFSDCHFQEIPLWGKVEVVDSFPDIKVKAVASFPDLKVEIVDSFPDKCGQWQWVESFPDFTIQFVDSFPDLTIQYVDSFPGVN